MYTGQISYRVFQYFGMWRPATWNSQWQIWIYHIHSTCMITVYSIFIFGMVIYLLRDPGEIYNNMETLFYVSAAYPVLIKLISIMVKRENLIDLKNMLLDKLCQPRDFFESEVIQSCSKVCRSSTIIFLLLTSMCAMPIILIPPSMRSHFPLPFKVWIPYSLESRIAYILTYFQQGVAIMIAACVTASVESLASVIILQICAQLEIIVHRLQSLPKFRQKNDSDFIVSQRESRLMKDCINHLNFMFLVGEKLNELFGFIISVQMFSSTIGLGAITYHLLNLSLSSAEGAEFGRLLCPLLTALLQIFLYCFLGEKIMDESMAIAKEVYQIDWLALKIQTKKDLSSIMLRVEKPMLLTDSTFIVMRIDTFVKIVKSAFSAYNVLKKT